MTLIKGSSIAGIRFKKAGGIFYWDSLQLATHDRSPRPKVLNYILSHLKPEKSGPKLYCKFC